ncbi:hypothetical protein B0H12DRAFT_116913 [Mycena haematopus]|nr:hypothetical protein B0H12DRAFT_116913 [Mycena haematopus]
MKTPGTAFIDKTRFIFELDQLMKSDPCFAALPPQTGKTAILSMYAAWVDCELPPNIRENIFQSTNIRSYAEKAAERSPSATTPQKISLTENSSMCLIFDFQGVELPARGLASVFTVTHSINQFLVQVIQDFAIKYEGRLGEIKFHPQGFDSPTAMIERIVDEIKSSGHKLFVGVDHWDDPILKSLSFENDALTNELASHITLFLSVLSVPQQSKIAHLLVFGNLPPIHLKSKPFRFRNISADPSMDGAFGITPEELDVLFSVLSHNRRTKLNTLEERLMRKLVAPSLPFNRRQPPKTYNFAMVLQYVETTLDVDILGAHKSSAISFWLKDISLCCEKWLRYSSLRRGRQIVIPALRKFNVLAPAQNEQNLWALLIYLGALVCSSKQEGGSMIRLLRGLWTSVVLSRNTSFSQDIPPLPTLKKVFGISN